MFADRHRARQSRPLDPYSGLLHAAGRRHRLAAALEWGEDQTRALITNMPEPQATAIWDATWQLRHDVMAACERCECSEKWARWARDG